MVIVAGVRSSVAWRYRQAPSSGSQIDRWRKAFVAGAALAGIGWGGAAILLYFQTSLTSQVFVLFVVGGMMLGAGSLLAPRTEAFLAFLVPAGLIPTVCLVLQGDKVHLGMALFAGLFTLATSLTTGHIHRTLETSIKLQFENRDLLERLRGANKEIEAANQALEARVRERTAELTRSTEQLKSEIAHRLEMEEELLRARKLESLGVLAGGIAHDFNNFLMVIQGHIELAKTRVKEGYAIDENLEQIARAYQRAALLSSQLLTFAKGGTPIRRLVSMADLISDSVQLARAGSSTSITVQLADDLGFAEIDPGQIGQVLHNILLNARQAMPKGGVIEVSAYRFVPSNEVEPRIRISIRDYGCGIAADVLPLIFDPYFTTKPSGNGLGLATAHAVVGKHGGQIFVTSKLGEGATFDVDLPASTECPSSKIPVVSDVKRGTARVLIMDDDAGVRYLLSTILNTLGYDAHAAQDGAEAIAMYEDAKTRGRPFEVCLLDLTVNTGMGGLETASKLKEIDPSAKLIVTSGYSDDPIMSDFARYGFDAVITKPSPPDEVCAVIAGVLMGSRDMTRH